MTLWAHNSDLVTSKLGTDAWINDTNMLEKLREFADDLDFQAQWRAVKMANKERLAAYIKKTTGYEINTSFMFDVQIKRIHECK